VMQCAHSAMCVHMPQSIFICSHLKQCCWPGSYHALWFCCRRPTTHYCCAGVLFSPGCSWALPAATTAQPCSHCQHLLLHRLLPSTHTCPYKWLWMHS
jgi:hypothetical protein